MKIIEKYAGFQGEGKYQGRNSLILRFPNCLCSCKFCDSKYSWLSPKILDIPDEEIFKDIEKSDNIMFTGGEPLIPENYEEIEKIIVKFQKLKTYEIETNGTINLKDNALISYFKENITFNISPKNNIDQINIDSKTEPILLNNIKSYNYIVKYLFDSYEDLVFITEQQKIYDIPRNLIYAQPKGTNSKVLKDLITKYYDIIISKGWNISYRSHIFLFENDRGF